MGQEGWLRDFVCGGPRYAGQSRQGGSMDLTTLNTNRVVSAAGADVAVSRERSRLRRLRGIGFTVAAVALWMWVRLLEGKPPYPVLPHVSGRTAQILPMLLLVVILGAAVLLPLL